MRWVPGGVTAPKGFVAAGVAAGIKRSRKPDLALVAADRPAAAAAVFTTNRVQAAPVLISRARARRGRAQAVLINSGCANCLTGPAGMRDALRVSRAAAEALRIKESHVLVASTGLIGTRLPVAKIERALPKLARQLSRRRHEAAAQAILTTDLHPKEAAVEARINGRFVRVGGMAKGSGMIAPSMATMLCVLTTDAAAPARWLGGLLREAAEETFNRISVDHDMSTNDTVFALAGGGSGAAIRPGTAGARRFARMVTAVAGRLAERLVRDGEGATKRMTVEVCGGRTAREAQACARQAAGSPLVKTMLAGSDANVGRLAAAAGASGARFDPARLEIHVEGVRLVAGGAALPVPAAALRRLLRRPHVRVRIHLHAGRASARMLTCDLTEEYVRINAGYAT
ncbi:MAG: bifunctional glutamate N-acetyltransferase/amino-acid acetyltransferase ArgJ [Candidatus Omnitrophica bacterium]|nr:bifunctional glutamate N-acetyltransferase/amino-acid acetyltransferase ArgJ [Candidatus Omnitrophota bacterium]